MKFDKGISPRKNKDKHTFTFISLIAAACLLYAVSSGLRSIYGIMLNTISADTGIPYASVSFAIAVGQFVFGVAQPAFGILAIKRSNKEVLIIGCLCMAVGLAAVPFCRTAAVLMLFFGILLPIGTGAISFGIIMSLITPKLGEEKAASASGIISGSSGLGSIVLSPLVQRAFAFAGLKLTMLGLGLLMFLMIPLTIFLSGKGQVTPKLSNTAVKSDGSKSVSAMLIYALRNRNFCFLMIGFFTCGFHMAIIETHLFSQIITYGVSDSSAALAFSVYGIASIAGCLLSGALCTKFQMKYVLGTLYGSRIIWVLGFLLLPKNIITVMIFCTVLGMTGAATVTPTSGLVSKLFGSENLATLFGIVFVFHQIGSFLSAWLGGKCVEITGEYTLIWLIAAVLSLIAMLVSYRIKENA